MYAKRIIPCLDVKEGRVVKGVNFVNLIDAGFKTVDTYDELSFDKPKKDSERIVFVCR